MGDLDAFIAEVLGDEEKRRALRERMLSGSVGTPLVPGTADLGFIRGPSPSPDAVGGAMSTVGNAIAKQLGASVGPLEPISSVLSSTLSPATNALSAVGEEWRRSRDAEEWFPESLARTLAAGHVESLRSIPPLATKAAAAIPETIGRVVASGGGLQPAEVSLPAQEAVTGRMAALKKWLDEGQQGWLGGLPEKQVDPHVAATRLVGEPEEVGGLDKSRLLGDVMENVDILGAAGLAKAAPKLALRAAEAGMARIAATEAATISARNASGSTFARAVAKQAEKGIVPPPAAADFLDSVLASRPVARGIPPMHLAASIEEHGLEAAARIYGLPEDDAKAIAAALGDNSPASFIRTGKEFSTRSLKAGEAMRERELVRLGAATWDPDDAVKLVAAGHKPVGLASRPFSKEAAAEASKAGLKMTVVNDAIKGTLKRPFDALRVVYDPKLIDAIWEGMKASGLPVVQGKAGSKFVDAEHWLKDLIRKDPSQLEELGSGTIHGKFYGGASVDVTNGVKAMLSRVAARPTDVSVVAKEAHDAVRAVMGGATEFPGLTADEVLKIQAAMKSSDPGAKLAVRISGRPIEASAAKAGVPKFPAGVETEAQARALGITEAEEFPMLRVGQAALRSMGLDQHEVSNLVGSMLGEVTGEQAAARAQMLTEAGRLLVARGKAPTVEAAQSVIADTLAAMKAKLPPKAKFMTLAEGKEVAALAAPEPKLPVQAPVALAPEAPETALTRSVATRTGVPVELPPEHPAVVQAMAAEQAQHSSGVAVAEARKTWVAANEKMRDLYHQMRAASVGEMDAIEKAAVAASDQAVAAKTALNKSIAESFQAEFAAGDAKKQLALAAGAPEEAAAKAGTASLNPPELDASVAEREVDYLKMALDRGDTAEQAAKDAEAAAHQTMAGGPGHGGPDDPSVPRLGKLFGVGDVRSAIVPDEGDMAFHHSKALRWMTHTSQGRMADMGPMGRGLVRSWQEGFMERIAWQQERETLAKLRRRVLPDRTSQTLAGALREGDLRFVQDSPGGQAWMDEVLAAETPRAQAVHHYMDLLEEEAKAIAEHVPIPWNRRTRDYFPHLADRSKSLAAKWGFKRPYELSDWAANQIPKEAYYSGLEERMGSMGDYIRNPEDAFRIMRTMGARYRFLNDLLPKYGEFSKALRTRGQMDLASDVDQNALLLTEPRGNLDRAFRRWVEHNMDTKWYAKKVATWAQPDLVPRTIRALKQFNLVAALGLNPKSAVVNLSTLPLHTALKFGWEDTAAGILEFSRDAALAGVFKGGQAAHLKGVGRSMPSELWQILEESNAAQGLKHIDADLEPGLYSRVKAAREYARETAVSTAMTLFSGTEGFNRGASFYAGARRALKALDEVRSGKALPEWAYDGAIAPANHTLLEDLAVLKKRLPDMADENAGFVKTLGKSLEPTYQSGQIKPEEYERVTSILAGQGDDIQKARAIFKADEEALAAAKSEDPLAYAKSKGEQAVADTQFIYTRQNRPAFIVKNEVLEPIFQFQDFMRNEFEMFSRMPWTAKGMNGKTTVGPALQFAGMLMAIGGARALPFVQDMMEVAGFFAPEGKAKLDTMLSDLEAGRLSGGVPTSLTGWLGVDGAQSIRLGSATPMGTANPYPDAPEWARVASGLGGATGRLAGSFVAPALEAASRAATLRGDGVKPGVAREAGTHSADLGLRQEVPIDQMKFLGVPVGGAMASGPGMAALNLPSSAFGVMGMDTAASILRFRPGATPGTLEIPGEVPLAAIVQLKQMAQAAQRAETGVAKGKGKVLGSLARKDTLGHSIGAALAPLGFGSSAPREERELTTSLKGTPTDADKAHEAFKDLLVATMVGATPGEMRERSIALKHPTSEQEFATAIQAQGKSPLSRMVAQTSKRGAVALMEHSDYMDRYREAMAEKATPGATVPQIEEAAGAMQSYTSARQRVWSQKLDEATAKGEILDPVQAGFLLKEAQESGDQGLVELLDKATANVYKVGSAWKKNDAMEEMRTASTQGKRAVLAAASALAEGNLAKEYALVQIGMHFMGPEPGTSAGAAP